MIRRPATHKALLLETQPGLRGAEWHGAGMRCPEEKRRLKRALPEAQAIARLAREFPGEAVRLH